MKKLVKKIAYTNLDLEIFPADTLPMNVRQLKLFQYFSDRYKNLKGVSGEIVECGVGHGRTMLYLCFLAQQEALSRTIWGFDSFEGFPEPTSFDDSARNPKKGDWSDTSKELITRRLKRAGISDEFINTSLNLVKGFFPDSFKNYTGAPIALLHVDVDLYQSYADALSYFYYYVVDGGLVLFDEYKHEKWPGATKAIDEFLEYTKQNLIYDELVEKYYIIKNSKFSN